MYTCAYVCIYLHVYVDGVPGRVYERPFTPRSRRFYSISVIRSQTLREIRATLQASSTYHVQCTHVGTLVLNNSSIVAVRQHLALKYREFASVPHRKCVTFDAVLN